MVRSWCGLTEEVLDERAESALDKKGCFNRVKDNSGFHKVDLSFPPQSPRARLDSTRWSQAPRVALALPLLVRLKMVSAPAPSLHARVEEGMARKLCLHPVNQAWGHTLLQGKVGNVVFSRGHTLGIPLPKGGSRNWILGNLCPNNFCLREARAETWSTLEGAGRFFKTGQYRVLKKHLSTHGTSGSVASNHGAVVVTCGRGRSALTAWVSLAFWRFDRLGVGGFWAVVAAHLPEARDLLGCEFNQQADALCLRVI